MPAAQEAERLAKRPKVARRKKGALTAKELEAKLRALEATILAAKGTMKSGLQQLAHAHEASDGGSTAGVFKLWKKALSPDSLEGGLDDRGGDVSTIIEEFIDQSFEPPPAEADETPPAEGGGEAEDDEDDEPRPAAAGEGGETEEEEPLVHAHAEPVPQLPPAQVEAHRPAAQQEGAGAKQQQPAPSEPLLPSQTFPNGPPTPSDAEPTQSGAWTATEPAVVASMPGLQPAMSAPSSAASASSTTTHANGAAGRRTANTGLPTSANLAGIASGQDAD